MMSKVVLVIIFNHKYDKNIPILEKIYKGRFSNILYIVPFYTGDRKDVIPVYENSIYFQGYISQALKTFYNRDFEHYFFIGDDLILNPLINENNYKEHLKLNRETSFLPGFIPLHNCRPWARISEAYEYSLNKRGVEVKSELPTYMEALDAFKKLNLEIEPVTYSYVYEDWHKSTKKTRKDSIKWWYRSIKHAIKKTKLELSYPLIGSYSDIIVVSADVIQKFCHYSGVFAATDLFVEIAIPTALVLATSQIITEKDLDLKGKALWSVKELAELDVYDLDFDRLLSEFPANYIYLHPVKLSKWRSVAFAAQ
jgi:hypothetical protein